MNENLQFKGHLEIINADTKEILAEADNMILDTGFGLIGSRVTNSLIDVIDYIAIGTSNTAVSASQTSLVTEIFRKQMIDKDGGGTSLFFRGETLITGNEAVGTWREYGMVNASSGGIFFNRVLKDFTHPVGINIIVRFTVTMARA